MKKEDITKEWLNELKASEIKEIKWLELKSGDTKRIGESITAFLNQQTGGLILYGIKEKDCSVVDFDLNESLTKISQHQTLITDPCQNEVHAEDIEIESKKIIAIFVKEGKHFPYMYNGIIYIRGQNGNAPIRDKRMIKHLLSSGINISKILEKFKKNLAELEQQLKTNLIIVEGLKQANRIPSYNIPFKFDEQTLEYYLIQLSDYLTEKGHIDSFREFVKKIKQINVLIELIYPRLEDWTALSNHLPRFGNLFEQALEKVIGLRKTCENLEA